MSNDYEILQSFHFCGFINEHVDGSSVNCLVQNIESPIPHMARNTAVCDTNLSALLGTPVAASPCKIVNFDVNFYVSMAIVAVLNICFTHI